MQHNDKLYRGGVESSPRCDEQDLLSHIRESVEIGDFKMEQQVVTVKTCPRCGGSGRYSFNLRDADRCYGCGGTGKVPCAPKGQKRIKPTCDDYKKAVPGDIVSIARVLYRVEEIKWIKLISRGWDLSISSEHSMSQSNMERGAERLFNCRLKNLHITEDL